MVSGSDTVVSGMCVGAAMDLLILVCSVNALLDDHLGSLKDGTAVSMSWGSPIGSGWGGKYFFLFFHSSYHYINDKLPR